MVTILTHKTNSIMTKQDLIDLDEVLSKFREAYDIIEGKKQGILEEMRQEKRIRCIHKFNVETPYERMDVATDMLQFSEEYTEEAIKWLERSFIMCKSLVKLP